MSTLVSITVGDQVVHPRHGLGVVTATATVDLGAGPTFYVTIDVGNGLTVKVPAASLAEIGIREPVTTERAEEILAVLAQPAEEDPGHRIRRRRDADKLASGNLTECAEVVRDLTMVVTSHVSGGHYADRQMLSTARTQLAAELAVVLGSTAAEGLVRIDDALATGTTAAL